MRYLGPVLNRLGDGLPGSPEHGFDPRGVATLGLDVMHGQTLVKVLGRFADHDWPWYSRLARAVGDHPPMDLSAIDIPVTYLAGTWDAITSAKQMRAASEQTPHSRYVELAAVSHRLGGRPPRGYVDQDHEAGRAFDESAYRRTVSGTHDAVTFPMPDLYPVVDLDGSISDHRHVGEPTPSLQALDAASAPSASPLGRAGHIGPRIVDRLIDRLRTQVALGLIREVRPEFVGDLFGTPPLAQQLGDDTMKLLVTHHASRPQRPGSPLSAQPLRGGGQVAATIITVAAKLPRHRRGSPAQLVGDVAHTDTRTMQISDRRALGQ